MGLIHGDLPFIRPLITVDEAMTVLIGAMGPPIQDDVIILADTMVFDKEGKPTDREALKTLRVNDHCGIGFAGRSETCNQIAAYLFDRKDLLMGAKPAFERLEEAKAELTDKPLHEIRETLEHLVRDAIAEYEKTEGDSAKLELTVLLAGREGKIPIMYRWSKLHDWILEGGPVTLKNTDVMLLPSVPCPKLLTKARVKELVVAFALPGSPLKTKIRRAMSLCIEWFPNEVSHRVQYRRLSRHFQLEELHAS